VGEATSLATGGLSGALVVVKDHVGAAPVIWFPATSFALTVKMYFVDQVRSVRGVIVTVLVVDAYAVVNGTAVPPAVRVATTDAGWIGSLKVAVGFTVTAAPTVPLLGVVDVTVGGVRSVPPAADATAGVKERRPVSRRTPGVRPRRVGVYLIVVLPVVLSGFGGWTAVGG